jgi:carboxypeptidase Q
MMLPILWRHLSWSKTSAFMLAVSGVALTSSWTVAGAPAGETWLDPYREPASRIIGGALATTFAWDRLAELTDNFGARLSGSPQLEKAILWAIDKMKEDGLENVHAEKVMVPHWVRGAESAEVVRPVSLPMVMLGLGGSIGTGQEGIEAEILVVRSFGELDAAGERARGKIVVYNVPYVSYGRTVEYRAAGASRAARLGASAVLLRSVGLPGLRTPHTGALSYAERDPKIPAAAISLEDADMLQRYQDRGQKAVVRLKMEAHFLDEAESANVVGELRGREKPEEVVVLGGHLDSWDVGAGAVDDGGGCLVTWTALKVLKDLDLRPRRTIRVVLFTNEENGLRGGYAYRDAHKDELANHVMMMESDSGTFRPLGFGLSANDRARTTVREIAGLLDAIGASKIEDSGGGADISPSVRAGRIPSMSLEVDGSRYFLYHHTPADTIDKLNPMDMALGVAAVGVMSYVIADMPDRLGQ